TDGRCRGSVTHSRRRLERRLPLGEWSPSLSPSSQQELRMRTSSLTAAMVAGALLVGCSKPEPAAGGAPSPNTVTLDSTKAADSTAKPADSAAAAVLHDSMKKDQ